MQRVDRWLLITGYVVLILTLAIATWQTSREVEELKDQVQCLTAQVIDRC